LDLVRSKFSFKIGILLTQPHKFYFRTPRNSRVDGVSASIAFHLFRHCRADGSNHIELLKQPRFLHTIQTLVYRLTTVVKVVNVWCVGIYVLLGRNDLATVVGEHFKLI
jgi:hypothetical protein